MPAPVFHTLPVAEIREEAPGVKTFFFDVPEGLAWEPASHVHVALPGFNANGERHRELVHLMNVCTLMSEGRIGFTTRLDSSDSVFKRALARVEPGDELTLFKFQAEQLLLRDGSPVVALTQGVALAVVRPLALAVTADAEGVPFFTSITVDRSEPGMFSSELAAAPDMRVAVTKTSNRGEFERAVRRLPEPEASSYIVVGSDEFMRGTIALLRELGVADERIILDRNERRRAAYFA